MKKDWKDRLMPYLFIAPTMVLIFVFSYYAIFNAIITSFTDSHFGVSSNWIGLQNYRHAFSDSMFIKSFINQGILSGVTVFNSVFFPLLASILLFFIKRKETANWIKTAFVIPMLVPSIVLILIWKFLYNPNFGFNSFLSVLGLGRIQQNWLNSESTALWSVVVIGFPFISSLYFLILHTAINMIDTYLYEAARLDGASNFDIVRHIQIPLIMPSIKVVVTLSLIGSLSGFGLIAATTGGGPGYATMIPAMQMYNTAFGDGKFGYASALGVILFVVIFGLTLLLRNVIGRVEHE